MSNDETTRQDGCPDENVIADYCDGQLERDQTERLRAHLDECLACRRLTAAFARAYIEEDLGNARTIAMGQDNTATAAVAELQAHWLRRLHPGSKLGRYVVREVIGAGGMGVVYAAYDPELRRDLAIKVVAPSDEESVAQSKRLLREARAAAKLQHANVVAIFDVGQVEGATYLVMELIRGHSLRESVGDPSVPLSRRIGWLVDVARALSAAHHQALVHRDVKPENVMVRDDGGIKVVDFGIARSTDVDLAPSTPAFDPQAFAGPESLRTTEGRVRGTPRYMAPEQLAGAKFDGRSDQYAWGIMAYELLRGVHPAGDRYSAVGSLESLKAIADVPLPVAEVVAKAMAPSPAARHATMDDIVRALEPFTAGASITPHTVPPGSSSGVSARADAASTASVPPVGDARAPAREGSESPTSSWGSARWGALAFVLLLLAAGAGVGWRLHKRAGAAQAGSPSPAPAPTPVTSLALPNSANREAVAAYAEAMQAFRDGAGFTARVKFARAAELDPMLAAAHLQETLFLVGEQDEVVRASLQRARELRSFLSERDRGFLDALEPTISRTQADSAEAARRFSALSQRYPGDAEIAYELGVIRLLEGDYDGGVASTKQALALDPSFIMALAVLGNTQAYLGDFDLALQTLDQCMTASAAATTCAVWSADIHVERGECEAAAATTRGVRATTPGSFGYTIAAEAALARDEPPTVVRGILDQAPETEPWKQARKELRLAALSGDFVAAEEAAGRMATALSHEPAMQLHMSAACQLSDVYVETGRAAEAGKAAQATLRAMGGWEPEPRVDDDGISRDRTPRLLADEHRAGLLSKEEMIAKRDAWQRAWEAKAPPFFRGYLWVQTYSETVDTPDDAREALSVLPEHGGIPPFRSGMANSVGRIYWLAGDLDRAIPALRLEARSCTAYRFPFEHVRANYLLGRALEAKGQTKEACDAYGEVLSYWGNARPRSITADGARQHALTLHCKARPHGD